MVFLGGGDLFLHHERLLPGGQGNQDPLYPARRAAVFGGQRGHESATGSADRIGAYIEDLMGNRNMKRQLI